MASKKQLRGRIRAWKDAYDVLAENLAAARKSLVDLRAEVTEAYTDYTDELDEYQDKLAKLTDQATTLDKVIRERDKALRELQAARVAAEALGKALYPVTYAKGGVLPATITADKIATGKTYVVSAGPGGAQGVKIADSINVGDLSGLSPAANETYRSIMGLMNKSWKPQSYQSPKPAADPKPDA